MTFDTAQSVVGGVEFEGVEVGSLILVLGDQLAMDSPLLQEADPQADRVVMIEALEESTNVWSHKARIAVFLSAMRHFAQELQARGFDVTYLALDDQPMASLGAGLEAVFNDWIPERVVVVEPGDLRVGEQLRATCERRGVLLTMVDDTSFLVSRDEFARWMAGRSQIRMEHFYRYVRRTRGYLMEGDHPMGGRWNFDEENRDAFDASGPPFVNEFPVFASDAIRKDVNALVERVFPDHPGELGAPYWPATRSEALSVLSHFVDDVLPYFGQYQDAMWRGQPLLGHSLLSVALNLKLLRPDEVVRAVEDRYRSGSVSLASAEGFIRQVVGWREYVRGLYFHFGKEWFEWNALDASRPLPAWYWNGETEMACLGEVLGQTLRLGYAHHIQRLMVTGLFALLWGVEPAQVHRWYLAIYVDAVEWVELPNVLGMSQYADGGRMASKPYIASGAYISRMSNYCEHCVYRPKQASGPDACPFTTLYWDFLDRHRERLRTHPRLGTQIRNLERKSDEERAAIRSRRDELESRWVSREQSSKGTEEFSPSDT
jgi:deoxyribodipyrimidine photolyase-related protein